MAACPDDGPPAGPACPPLNAATGAAVSHGPSTVAPCPFPGTAPPRRQTEKSALQSHPPGPASLCGSPSLCRSASGSPSPPPRPNPALRSPPSKERQFQPQNTGPIASGRFPQGSGSFPLRSGNRLRGSGSFPRGAANLPMALANLPEPVGNSPAGSGNLAEPAARLPAGSGRRLRGWGRGRFPRPRPGGRKRPDRAVKFPFPAAEGNVQRQKSRRRKDASPLPVSELRTPVPLGASFSDP